MRSGWSCRRIHREQENAVGGTTIAPCSLGAANRGYQWTLRTDRTNWTTTTTARKARRKRTGRGRHGRAIRDWMTMGCRTIRSRSRRTGSARTLTRPRDSGRYELGRLAGSRGDCRGGRRRHRHPTQRSAPRGAYKPHGRGEVHPCGHRRDLRGTSRFGAASAADPKRARRSERQQRAQHDEIAGRHVRHEDERPSLHRMRTPGRIRVRAHRERTSDQNFKLGEL